MTLLHDAIRSIIPAGSRPSPYEGGQRYKFNCPLCHVKGHTKDTRKRGAFFLSPDGSAGYDCLQCQTRTRQAADLSLTKTIREILIHMGMSDSAVTKLSYELWRAKIAKQQGIAPRPYIEKQPLPAGAKPIGLWIADKIADEHFNALLLDLADMTEERRDGLYWTPDPGPSGFMNKCMIEVIGPRNDPMGWAALRFDNPDAEPLLSDPNILSYNDEDDQ